MKATMKKTKSQPRAECQETNLRKKSFSFTSEKETAGHYYNSIERQREGYNCIKTPSFSSFYFSLLSYKFSELLRDW